jgi:hypothetical protein
MAQNKSLKIKIFFKLQEKLYLSDNLSSNIDIFERLRTNIFLVIYTNVRISIEKSETHII